MLSYAVVTPARNEIGNLPRLADAMRAQSHRPVEWVVVDDGSDDGSVEFLHALAAEEPWVRVVERGAASAGTLIEGRREGRDLLAFKHGVHALEHTADIVVKVDADLAFAPDYFERLCAHFEADPKVAMASGSCHELEDGEWVRRRVIPTAVWGASRAYRSDCLDAVMTLEPRIGWDALDELRLHVRGYKTGHLVDLPFEHHRPEHTREPGRMRAHATQGRAAWYMGYRPTYLTIRTLYRVREDRAAIGMLWGYAAAAVRRESRFPEPEVRRALRDRQRLTRTLRPV